MVTDLQCKQTPFVDLSAVNMGEQILKLTVNQVNNLLNSNYNMISFDSLPRNALLQIVVDCLNKMDTFPKMNVEQNMEDALSKLVKFLSDIKAPAAVGVDVNDFADGIINGKRTLLLPTLFWILSNQEEVKKRSYLSKYLIKVDMNAAILNEPDVQPILLQYDDLLEQFKRIYTQTSKYNKIAKATVQLRNDLDKQTKDTANIIELLNKQKAKMENIANKESLTVSVRGLRTEMASEKQLSEQLIAQADAVSALKRAVRAARDQRASIAPSGADVDEPLSRLQLEVQATRSFLTDRTSVELQQLRDRLRLAETAALLDEHASTGAVDEQDQAVRELRSRVDRAQLDLSEMVERETTAGSVRANATRAPTDDKLAQFRQHAALVANGKRLAAQRLVELREERAAVGRQVAERERQLREAVGGGGSHVDGERSPAALPHGDDLRQFVGGLRGQSIAYKESRGRLLELQAEAGVLARTRDLLAQYEPQLIAIERKRSDATTTETANDETVNGNDGELRRTCAHTVASVIHLRVAASQSAIKLRDRLATLNQLQERHQQQKQLFDAALENYNKKVNQLQSQVNQFKENIAIEEGKWKETRNVIDEREILLESLYNESLNRAVADKFNVEVMNGKVKEEDRRHSELEEELRKCEANKDERERQASLWHSTLVLLQCKRETGPSQ